MPYGRTTYRPKRRFKRKPKFNRRQRAGSMRNRRLVKYRRGPTVKSLSKRVSALKKMKDHTTGTFINREDLYTRLITINGQANTTAYVGNSQSDIGNLTQFLRYFDPEAPVTLTTTDFNAGGYSKELQFSGTLMELTIRANYLLPVYYTIYYGKAKQDTNVDPETAYVQGVGDVSADNILNILMRPTDVPLVQDLWGLKTVKKGYLKAGEQVKV